MMARLACLWLIAFGAAALLVAGDVRAREPEAATLSAYARPQSLVEVAPGRRMNLFCTGDGHPTVVFEAGLGWPALSWRKVQPEIARRTRACAYDRAGLGFSDSGPLPRTAARMVSDLRALLSAAGERPPYVLVGGSLGSYPVRLFAARHPRDVVGVVLVDPIVEGQDARLAAAVPALAASNRALLRRERNCAARLVRRALTAKAALKRGCIDAPNAEFPPDLRAALLRQRMHPSHAATIRSETLAMFGESERQVAAVRRLGSTPLIVLTGGDALAGETLPKRDIERLKALRTAMHTELARLSTRGEHRVVAGAGHVIQSTTPEAVVAATLELVAAARRPGVASQ